MPGDRQFDWITQDEGGVTRPEPPAPAPPRRRMRWARWLPALLLVALAGLTLWRQARGQYDAVAGQVERDVLAAHGLLQDALRRGDAELLGTLVSAADPGWAAPVRQLARQGLLFAPTPLDLTPAASAGAASVTVAATLDEVDLTWLQAFQARTGETVTLRQHARYRLEAAGWRLAPRDAAFWGEMRTVERGRLSLSYPARDEAVSLRLARDLDAALAAMCRQLPDLDCPADLRLFVRLQPHPVALADMADPARLLAGDDLLALPAPTLVGLPDDGTADADASYRALARGYASAVVSRAIADQVGWTCCRHGPFFQALLDAELAQLGLRPWPLTPAVYRQLFREPIPGIRTLIEQWSQELPIDPSRWKQVYGVVDFMLRGREPTSPVALQRRLVQAEDYYAWLSPTFDFGFFDVALDQVYVTYLAEQAGLQAGDAPAVPWPEQDIYVLCGRSILRGLRLYRYRPANDAWQALMRDEPFMFMAGAPAAGDLVAGDGLLLQAWGSAQARTRLLAFAPGADRPWLDERQTGAGLVAEGEALAGLFAALAGSGPADQAAAAPAAERLAAALGLPAADLAVQAALATLDHPDLIFVGATDRGRGQGLVLATDPAGDRVDVRLRLERPLARFDPLALSPDGRWLTARSAAPPPGAWEIALHAISGERTLRFASNYLYTYPGHDWSEDGRWWLRMENGLIHLVSPDAGVERAIVHPFRMCAFGTWAR